MTDPAMMILSGLLRFWRGCCCAALLLQPGLWLLAQDNYPHFQHGGALPPGEIGQKRLLGGGPLPGYFQPVELIAPGGSQVSLAIEGQFTQPLAAPVKLGLLIGSVYRYKITNIPNQPGLEIYPTVELIDRTYPPRGEEFRFPVPIELTDEEMSLALGGKFVTRVIYIENPQAALPQHYQEQSFFEVRPGDDPLAVADRLGRPIAILRIGGRLPTNSQTPGNDFLFGSPAMLLSQDVVRQLYPDLAPPQLLPAKNSLTQSLPKMTTRPAAIRLNSPAAAVATDSPPNNAGTR
ncbi:MAG: hypothetical protein SFX18_00645 [Pirellulales bacterium]|nr:hypothetical protein [Pirellulales bacterium]